MSFGARWNIQGNCGRCTISPVRDSRSGWISKLPEKTIVKLLRSPCNLWMMGLGAFDHLSMSCQVCAVDVTRLSNKKRHWARPISAEQWKANMMRNWVVENRGMPFWGGYFRDENSHLSLISHFLGPNSTVFFKCHIFWNGKRDVGCEHSKSSYPTSKISSLACHFKIYSSHIPPFISVWHMLLHA